MILSSLSVKFENSEQTILFFIVILHRTINYKIKLLTINSTPAKLLNAHIYILILIKKV